jgi:hypothetical protein
MNKEKARHVRNVADRYYIKETRKTTIFILAVQTKVCQDEVADSQRMESPPV